MEVIFNEGYMEVERWIWIWVKVIVIL